MTYKHLKKHTQTRNSKTIQTQPIFGREKEMTKNSAGGYTFTVDDWVRLERFLVIGTSGGTYYISQKKLTIDNAKAVINCIKENGIRVVDKVIEVSDQGRAPKNDQALFVMAMCMNPDWTTVETRRYAAEQLPKIARIGTHILNFTDMATSFRGWGKLLRKAVGGWFDSKHTDALAFQAIKYASRNNWALKDLARLVHPKIHPNDHARAAVMQYITHPKDLTSEGTIDISPRPKKVKTRDGSYLETTNRQSVIVTAHPQITAMRKLFDGAQTDQVLPMKTAVQLITDNRLPREAIPTELLNEVVIWEALLKDMPLTAMIRNLGKMTSIGVLSPMNPNVTFVVKRITDKVNVAKSRIHPINVLVAMKTYASGHGLRGKLSWTPIPQIVDALDKAFYIAFGNVKPTGKNFYLALDISGSMDSPVSGDIPLTCAEASVAMAMVTANTETNYHIRGFSSAGRGWGWGGEYNPEIMKDLRISPRMRMSEVTRRVYDNTFGATDCALPMVDALKKKIPVDVFCIYTDNQTWAGSIQPVEALRDYRKWSGRPAKLVVVGMNANDFSIADPNDADMLDVVGMDTSVPQIIADFSSN